MRDKMIESDRIKISKAIQKELIKNPKIRVLLHLQEKGQLSAYQIAKDFDWKPSKAHYVVKQLEQSKSIIAKPTIVNGRAVKLIRLTGN